MPETRNTRSDSLDPSRYFRSAMTPMPTAGGDPGEFEERLAQWFLEVSFFKDFVARNPKGKGGRGELADAVILFDDVALMVQVKAQFSKRPPVDWAKKKIPEALGQLSYTSRMLMKQIVPSLRSETFGDIAVKPDSFSRVGVIVLAQDSPPFDARKLAPAIGRLDYPVHVLGLRDLEMLVSRFDTAGDFIPYLEYRALHAAGSPVLVHDEAGTLRDIAEKFGNLLSRTTGESRAQILERSALAFRKVASGQLRDSREWVYGLMIDGIIANAHCIDPSVPWNEENALRGAKEIAVYLSWMNRLRRVELGKRCFKRAVDAARGGAHYVWHYQRSVDGGFVFLASDMPRVDRVEYLKGLTLTVQAKYNSESICGAATGSVNEEPIRCDCILIRGRMDEDLRSKVLGAEDVYGILRHEDADLRPEDFFDT